jgi:hypothetical protein
VAIGLRVLVQRKRLGAKATTFQRWLTHPVVN